MELSEKERLIIANQLLILEKLYPEEAESYSRKRKAVEQGYSLHYSWLTEGFFEEMTEQECREVVDILDMYRSLTFSYRDLDDKQGIDEKQLQFSGFDGNEEDKQFSYTQYFIVDLGRFDELRRGLEYPDFNSHWPMLERYRRMLTAWKALPDRLHLDRDELVRVLEA